MLEMLIVRRNWTGDVPARRVRKWLFFWFGRALRCRRHSHLEVDHLGMQIHVCPMGHTSVAQPYLFFVSKVPRHYHT